MILNYVGPKDEMPCLIKYAHLLGDRNKDDHGNITYFFLYYIILLFH